MKNNNQLIGGISALIEAFLYIFGFIILFYILQPTIDETKTGLDKLKYIIDRKAIYQTWLLLIYVFFGIVLVFLTVAISENLNEQATIWTNKDNSNIWVYLVRACDCKWYDWSDRR